MNQMTLQELYEVGCSFESAVGQGTKSEIEAAGFDIVEL